MWAEATKDLDGTYDVDDFVTGFVRTEGPTITLNGAWAQNIGIGEAYIDFIGTKAGARLTYGGDFTVYTTSLRLALRVSSPSSSPSHHFQEEIDAFVRCIQTGEKLPSHIDHGHHHRKDDAGDVRFLGGRQGDRALILHYTGKRNDTKKTDRCGRLCRSGLVFLCLYSARPAFCAADMRVGTREGSYPAGLSARRRGEAGGPCREPAVGWRLLGVERGAVLCGVRLFTGAVPACG